jgi:N-acetylglucosamine-6-sulfatase
MDSRHAGGRRVQSAPLSRRAALRALGIGSAELLGGLGRLPSARARSDGRPNILFILADDLRVDDLAAMPAVQELLVRQGTSFANFMTASPLCAPARASILRGQYPHNHGILRGSGERGGFDLFHTSGHEASTIATWLRDAGYRTALIGKYLNGYPGGEALPADVTASYVPPGWDEWVGLMDEGYYRFTANDNGEMVESRTGKRRQFDSGTEERNPYSTVRKNLYSTDYFAARAAKFIADPGEANEPFFVYLAPYAVHGPVEPAQRHTGMFAGTPAPRTPAFNEPDVSDKPAEIQATAEMGAAEIAALDERHALRLETLQAVDELVAVLVETLDALGLLARTFIVLTSDNGYHLGEHRLAAEKGSPYEEATRVPLVVRGPGVAAGETVTALASQIDLAPTFAAWGDAAVPDFVDGRSLAPLLTGEASPATWRNAVLVAHSAHSDDPDAQNVSFDVLRGPQSVYVEYASGDRELYDLAADPHQLTNLASDASPALLGSLSERLAALEACAGATCRSAEDAPLPEGFHFGAGTDAAVDA